MRADMLICDICKKETRSDKNPDGYKQHRNICIGKANTCDYKEYNICIECQKKINVYVDSNDKYRQIKEKNIEERIGDVIIDIIYFNSNNKE